MAARLFFSKSFKKVLLSSGVYVILKYLSAENTHHLSGCSLSYINPPFMLEFTAGLGYRQQTIDILNSPALVELSRAVSLRSSSDVRHIYKIPLSIYFCTLQPAVFSQIFFQPCLLASVEPVCQNTYRRKFMMPPPGHSYYYF